MPSWYKQKLSNSSTVDKLRPFEVVNGFSITSFNRNSNFCSILSTCFSSDCISSLIIGSTFSPQSVGLVTVMIKSKMSFYIVILSLILLKANFSCTTYICPRFHLILLVNPSGMKSDDSLIISDTQLIVFSRTNLNCLKM